MITIFSSELDHSTSKVIEWIDRLTDMKVVRINYDRNDDVVFSGLISNDYPNRLVGKNANEIKSIWFRKNLNFSLEKTDTNDSSLKTHLSEENMAFNQGLASLAELSDCKVLGTSESEFSLVVNKVSALLKAKKCGILDSTNFKLQMTLKSWKVL
ncbi:MAG: hypothetical protein R2769_04605 [Saprospiraceae bacterium]